jgi:hypothetical protein
MNLVNGAMKQRRDGEGAARAGFTTRGSKLKDEQTG